MEEFRRIIQESEIMQEDDALWPGADRVGRQVSRNIFSNDGLLSSSLKDTRLATTDMSLLLCISIFAM